MIPLRDHNPSSTRAYVTWALIAINVYVFISNPVDLGALKLGAIPCDLTAACPRISEALASEFAGRSPAISVFTAMFMHADWLHLGGNMLFLWVFGNNVEDRLGHVKYLLAYLAWGLAATALHVFVNPDSQIPLIGASGAISGVLGAYLWLFPKARVTVLIPIFIFLTTTVRAQFLLIFWFVMQFLEGSGSGGSTPDGGGVAYLAHIGGFAVGYLTVRLLGMKRIDPNRPMVLTQDGWTHPD